MTPNDRLKRIIDEQGRKYIWVAHEVGILPSTLTDILKNKRKIDADLLLQFCKILGCSASDIIPTPYDNVAGYGKEGDQTATQP